MKKLPILLGMILVFSLVLCPFASAAGDNYDTLADWDIRIAVPDEATAAVLQGNSYYIYAQHEGYIPYVMLMATSRFSSEEEFIDYLNESMASQYRNQDFRITNPAELKTVGDKLCYEVDYAYTISGYDAVDRRIFITVGDLTYMFASKEVPSRGMTVGSMLEDVVADCVFLSEKTPDPEPAPAPVNGKDETGLYSAYLFCQDDGMPKYWLDFTGAIIDKPVLHCYFRSGDPTFYESNFILDFDPEELVSNGGVYITDICNARGIDVSDWFKWFSVELDGDGILLDIERDEKTLAGGTEDNIMTGVYHLEPAAATVSYEYYTDEGALKYWLVPNGEDIELHGMFRSGDPETYEDVYIFDGATAEHDGDYVTRFTTVFKSGSDVSTWFKSIVLSRVQTSYILSVERDEKTLAGGGSDNVLSGSYTFDPFVRFAPLGAGPFTEEDLGVLAQRYYFVNNGFFPPEADVEANDDGSFTVHLYEVVTLDDTSHTATSAWYTVDAFGVGVNDITGEEVYLAA